MPETLPTMTVQWHQQDGSLFRLHQNNLTQHHASELHEIIQRHHVERAKFFVIGSTENAELITRLYDLCSLQRHWHVLHISGPPDPRLATGQNASGPLATMLRAADQQRSPSLGGPHRATVVDYRTYAFLAERHKSRGRFTPQVQARLHAHPAWPAVSFPGLLNETAAAWLLSLIVDPRFQRDPEQPDRWTRLRTRFGLTGERAERRMETVLNAALRRQPDASLTTAERQLRLLLHTFACGWDSDRTLDFGSPRNFMLRVLCPDVAGPTPPSSLGLTPRAMLVACRIYLRFVCEVWLDQLTPSRQYSHDRRQLGRQNTSTVRVPRLQPTEGYAPQLFVPKFFFRSPAELAAWQEHLQRLGA